MCHFGCGSSDDDAIGLALDMMFLGLLRESASPRSGRANDELPPLLITRKENSKLAPMRDA